MTNAELSDDLRDATRAAWHSYLDMLTPFRAELHRYCRRLTGNIWDAEDLVQDTLLKGFAALGSVHATIANPRGYLIRVATNLWIDVKRQRATRDSAYAQVPIETSALPKEPMAVRDAGRSLLEQLAPQERAAVVLKDVFDMSLREIAQTLSTSENAVKAALHRGRERLKEEVPVRRRVASAALVDKFVALLNASDLPGLLALMLDGAAVEMPGALLEMGREEFGRKGSWLWQAVNVHPDMPADMRPPKWVNERVVFRDEPIVLSFMPLPQGRVLQGIARFEEEDGHIARIRSYCFSPELAKEIADELGLTPGWIPHRFPTPAPGKTWDSGR
ncbi:MAG TPA: RNA polymerase sigma factor [Rhizomicrobium sp.]|nr:RNA polymerase sigma factor [Rhizomicrobium sp.]